MTCSLFGHRDAPSSIAAPLTEMIASLIENEHTDRFLVGNQGCFDRMAYQILRGFPTVDFRVVLAYLPSSRSLDPVYRPEETLYPEGLEDVLPRFAIPERNRWMVDQSDIVLVYCRSSAGGTASILKYAKKKKKKIISLADYVDFSTKNSSDFPQIRASGQDKPGTRRV